MGMELGRPIRRVPRKSATNNDAPTRELADMPIDDQCYFLHCRGLSYRQIGSNLHITKERVMRNVKKVAASLRPTDEERLDWMQESVDSFRQVKAEAWEHWDISHDPYVLAQITAAEERIARIRGLMNNNALVETDGNVSITITGINPTSRIA